MHAKTITIAPRFNGPPNSGNGGYVSGLMAREIEGAAEVTLRAPPPLNAPLQLERADDGVVRLLDGDTLLGEARAAQLTLTPPPAPSLTQARDAEARYAGHADHRYPTCFTCGTGRSDGLHIYTGKVEGRDSVAATWIPTADGGDGRVAPEFIHAALDCPSYWALAHAGRPALLARFVSRIDGAPPRIGETCIIAAWPLSSDGRKHRGASALYTAEGELIALAEALWIEPRSA